MTEALRYPPGHLVGDYIRGTLGAVITGVPVLALDGVVWVEWVLTGIAVLCVWFLIRTAERHTQRVTLDDQGIAVAGWRSSRVDWASLETMKLQYFATKRDRSAGWMQLVVKGPSGRVEVDSRIEQFPAIVSAAHRAALTRDLLLTPSTLANLEHLDAL